TRVLRPSKGEHITFATSRFPLRDAVVMGAESRIVFAIPRHEMVIVGTTDTDFRGDPADVRAEREDIAYLLQVTEKYFPGAGLTARDILGCYAGVRPLIDDGARSESKTSREHAIWTDLQNVTFVAGGKYTTYRSMAAQTVREVLRHFSREERARLQHTRTLEALNPLVSGELLERARREHREWAREYGLDPQITALLADRHGLEAEAILARAAEQIPLDATADRSKQTQWMWCAEALHAMEHTMCLRLVDFYFRRTPLVLARTDHGLAFNKALAAVMGTRLNWSSERRLEEINALQNYLRRELSAIPQVDRVQ
ncbi:MAG: FAD-dependent oxidoreductase, partial [Bdellovibrionales bacterium]